MQWHESWKKGDAGSNWHESIVPFRDFVASRDSARRFLFQYWTKSMTNICDVAIIGAGPYGLSLAAHLAAAGVDFRIFGKTLDSWRNHMPKDMHLKSDGFASNICAPGEAGTLKAYCAARKLDYADRARPVPLDLFNE
jgi:hypothetical protein